MRRYLSALPKPTDVLPALTPAFVQANRDARAAGLSRRQLHRARAWNLDVLPSLELLRGGLIFDIGAHEGLWTQDVLDLASGSMIIAVEPQDDLRAQVEQRFASEPRVTVDGRALAAEEGTAEFHLMTASVNASLRPPRDELNAIFREGWDVERKVTVETTTVDALSAGRDVALLKIDVQGAEREVLAGATETLKRTSAVMLEVTFFSHYDGDATFAELDRQMIAAGFRLTGISEPARSPKGVMMTADAGYVATRHLDEFFR